MSHQETTHKFQSFQDSTRLRCPKLEVYPSRFSTAAQSCAFALSSTGCAQARTPSCRFGARVRPNYFAKQKRHLAGVFFAWRRKRDSNPRAGESRPNGLANRPLRPTWVFLRIKNILLKKSGGEGEIRTHGPYESLVFKTSSLNHSDTSPQHFVIVPYTF